MQLSSTPDVKLITRISYDANQNIEYVGFAAPGTGASDDRWKLINFVYDGNENIVQVLFASGNRDFDKIWNSRDSYTYS